MQRKSPDFPPLLLTSLTSVILVFLEAALHMSYTVSAATVQAVRASISTPVLPVVLALDVISTQLVLCSSAQSTLTFGAVRAGGTSQYTRDRSRALSSPESVGTHLIQHQVVAQRDQVRGLLRGLYACNLRNRENVPLLHLVRCHHFVHMRLKHNPRACFRDPRRVFLPTHVDHIALPPLVHMSQSLTRCHARLFHDPRLDHRADPGILLHLSHRSSAPLPELLPKDLLKLVIDLTHFTASSTTTTTFLADPSRPTRRLPKVARDRDEEILPECRGRLPACLPHSRRAHPSD
mmetsp:Transcript_13747/g.38726  ORF Transcript_13747/g.38726 Transcript_13747/m.38726 type:complete len:292 (-) Transcript_13747:33-908(-)